MIKINELRIGNYFIVNNEIHKYKLPKEFSIRKIKPLEITESLLLQNLNCIRLNDCLWLEYANNHDNGCFEFHFKEWFGKRKLISIIFYNDTKYWAFYENKNLRQHKLETGIYLNFKYVHQLQNLYFALKGEELTLSF
jgi:hypothetical protein